MQTIPWPLDRIKKTAHSNYLKFCLISWILFRWFLLSLISKFLFSLISEFLFTVLKKEVTKKVFWQETFLQLVTTACPHLIKMLFARHKLASKIQNLTCILVSLIWSWFTLTEIYMILSLLFSDPQISTYVTFFPWLKSWKQSNGTLNLLASCSKHVHSVL